MRCLCWNLGLHRSEYEIYGDAWSDFPVLSAQEPFLLLQSTYCLEHEMIIMYKLDVILWNKMQAFRSKSNRIILVIYQSDLPESENTFLGDDDTNVGASHSGFKSPSPRLLHAATSPVQNKQKYFGIEF